MPVSSSIGQSLLDVPMGDMIKEMAFAIAEAQIKLDENSIEVAEMMGGLNTVTDTAGTVTFEDSRVFFGTEDVDLNEAAAVFNSGDLAFKKAIKDSLTDSNNFEFYNGGVLLTGFESETDDVIIAAATALAKSSVDSATLVTVPVRLSMLELGFTPTFYQFVDTIIEVRIAISYTRESESEVTVNSSNKLVTKTKALRRTRRRLGRKSKNRTVTTNQVNATYSSKYSYSAEGSSLLRTKLAPVPPPEILNDRIRLQLEKAKTIAETPSA